MEQAPSSELCALAAAVSRLIHITMVCKGSQIQTTSLKGAVYRVLLQPTQLPKTNANVSADLRLRGLAYALFIARVWNHKKLIDAHV
eukprot:6201877-Pleurochrysis_carterae.AAC.4